MTIPLLIPNRNGLTFLKEGSSFTLKGPLFSLRRYPKLCDKSLVIGYVGPRGAGKSVNAARDIVINYLLRGKKVWSNMDIAFYLKTLGNRPVLLQTERFSKLKLKDLDLVYSDGCIYIDEINMELAEARRSMSNSNQTINYIVQQLRKRGLNLVWSAQSEMHVDSRVRWQTDIFIKCTDISKTKGPGELSLLQCYDYSGIYHGKSPTTQKDALICSTTVLNKPWWDIYNSWQLQGIDDDEEEEATVNKRIIEAREIAGEIVSYMGTVGDGQFLKTDLWKAWGIYGDTGMMGLVGIALRDLGIAPPSIRSAYFIYEKDLVGVT